MAQIDIVKELIKDNPGMPQTLLTVFADALTIYREAISNIKANGAIVAHPRTGAPIDNPYLKVQDVQGKILSRMTGIKADRVLTLLNK